LPDVWSYRDDEGENSLPNALPWDTIPAADYAAVGDVQPYVVALQKKSGEEVATNQDFVYVRQDIAELEKLQAQKTDTLNERKAWDEKEKIDSENKARDKEITSRKLPNEKIYEITVADAAQPGLPPAVQLETEAEATNSAPAVAKSHQPLNGPTTTPPSTPTANTPAPVTKVWGPDPMLDETERIMEDYISLWPSHETLIANHQ
jgi:hypothetical protein